MTTYKEINGTNIEAVSSDPANPVEGQVWYNTTSNELKGNIFQAAAWSTGGALNSARNSLAGAGTKDAGLAIAGSPDLSITESYNGTTWTEVADLNTGRQQLAASGTQTSALAYSGENASNVTMTASESWNGSTWTSTPSLNTTRFVGQGAGADNTNALAFNGRNPSGGGSLSATESWNGSAWTTVNSTNTPRSNNGRAGLTNTAALTFGGYNDPAPAATVNTELYNGTSWSEVGDLNTAVYQNDGSGSSTSALNFSGTTPVTRIGLTESWNGTSWTTVSPLSTAKSDLGASQGPSNTSALAFGGLVPPGETPTTATEEWTGAGFATVTFTDS